VRLAGRDIPDIDFGTVSSTDTWIHYALRRQSGVLTAFVNGVPVASTTCCSGSLDSTSSLKFGHRGSPGDTPGSTDTRGFFLNGGIDEVELFVGRALSDAEVQAIYDAGSAGKCKAAVVDTDGDGVPDDQDICSGFDDTVDTDNDGVPDGCDACPQDAANDADGDGICGESDACALGDDRLDADSDGTADACDLCPQDAANDADGDGICGNLDNCPTVANTNQSDADGDRIGDACEVDNDGDAVTDDNDNCPLEPNVDQA
jgi:hypothetical protein